MDYEALICLICSVNFDAKDHLPRIIPECGHTFCAKCLNTLIQGQSTNKCPLDNLNVRFKGKAIEDFPINFVFRQLLEEITTREDFCPTHEEEKKLICMSDQTLICDFCALFGDHKGHHVKPIKDMKPELNKKKLIVEKALSTIEDHYTEADRVLEEAHSCMLKATKRRFLDMKQFIENKEYEAEHQLSQFFSIQRTEVKKGFGCSSAIRQNLSRKLTEYKQPLKAERFLSLFR